jgi:hypothetical protein
LFNRVIHRSGDAASADRALAAIPDLERMQPFNIFWALTGSEPHIADQFRSFPGEATASTVAK